MGVRLDRQKNRNFLASILYRMRKLPVSRERRLKLFLDLEWIFDRLAHEASYDHYGNANHPMQQEKLDFILAGIKSSHVVLDLGCSGGDLTRKIAEKASFVVGIDHSKDAIESAKQFERDNLVFECKDAREYLDASDRTFDVLILSHVLEHLDDPMEFLQRLNGFFRFLYVEVPDFDRVAFNRYRQDLGLSLIYSDADHVSEFDRKELIALLAECNMQILRSEYIYGIQRYWCAFSNVDAV